MARTLGDMLETQFRSQIEQARITISRHARRELAKLEQLFGLDTLKTALANDPLGAFLSQTKATLPRSPTPRKKRVSKKAPIKRVGPPETSKTLSFTDLKPIVLEVVKTHFKEGTRFTRDLVDRALESRVGPVDPAHTSLILSQYMLGLKLVREKGKAGGQRRNVYEVVGEVSLSKQKVREK